MSDISKSICLALSLGALLGVAMKAVDWLIPSPDRRIVVCMNADTGKGICKTLADIDAAHAKKLPAFTDGEPAND